jgi:hypothetical protein
MDPASATVKVASGQGQPTIPESADLLENDKPLDRTTVNSWEDTDHRHAPHGPRPYQRPGHTQIAMRARAAEGVRQRCLCLGAVVL